MPNAFFKELSQEIFDGITIHGHPFRYITMATNGTNAIPRLCTVVLREVTDALKLTIYTDSRSTKINNLKENDHISILMYHPKKLLQIKIEGVAEIVTNEERLKKTWNNLPQNNKREYNTAIGPSNKISSPDDIVYLEDNNFFAMIDIIPKKIEYLKLKTPNHIRVLFKKVNTDWEDSFLVP